MISKRGPRERQDNSSSGMAEETSYRNMSLSFPPHEDVQDAAEGTTLLVGRDEERETTTTTNTLDNDEEEYRRRQGMRVISQVQQYANVAAHVLALAIILAVYGWISKLGGLIFPWQAAGKAKLVFNWHPLLMVTAFSFMTVSSLSFRAQWWKSNNSNNHNNRNIIKLIHATCWTVAALSATLGLLAVFQSHNDQRSGYIANMYSLHSWIGAGVILLYVAQLMVGLRAFGGPLASRTWSQPARALLLRFHVVIGPLIYFLTGVTILLGIQEKEGFVGCGYKVDSPDLFPIQHIGKIPNACLVSHTLGLLIFMTMIAVGLALADFRRAR
mmetsp:Transcript_6190/g.12720  ORF Transcript_6190/g.12720 Transcript_6190/m.12720 type:complete len:328 (-) Transcript_6190:146-1129(-)